MPHFDSYQSISHAQDSRLLLYRQTPPPQKSISYSNSSIFTISLHSDGLIYYYFYKNPLPDAFFTSFCKIFSSFCGYWYSLPRFPAPNVILRKAT